MATVLVLSFLVTLDLLDVLHRRSVHCIRNVIQFDSTARVVAESLSALDAVSLKLSMNGGGTAFGPALSQTIELLRRDCSLISSWCL